MRRFNVRINDDMATQLEYWSVKHNISISDYIREAIFDKIAYENKDYDLPTAEMQRVNQLQEIILTLSSNVQSLEQVVTAGFDSLLGLTRGDNYLLEESDNYE